MELQVEKLMSNVLFYSIKHRSALLIFGVLIEVLIRGRHSLRNHNIFK